MKCRTVAWSDGCKCSRSLTNILRRKRSYSSLYKGKIPRARLVRVKPYRHVTCTATHLHEEQKDAVHGILRQILAQQHQFTELTLKR